MSPNATILIVDDELGVRESLRMILKYSYHIQMAKGGEEALKYIRENSVQLILLDLKMPGLSGLETLREIRKTNKDVDVIIVTAYGSLENVQEALACGVKDFIAKPFDASETLHVVNRTIKKKNDILRKNDLVRQIRSTYGLGGEVPR
jgi:DNA-binding NtrC family response regulator